MITELVTNKNWKLKGKLIKDKNNKQNHLYKRKIKNFYFIKNNKRLK